MRYSYEYKRKCIELYREGRWPETPTGIKEPGNFHCMIRRWVREEEANGPEILKHTGTNKVWTPEEKYELVAKVVAGAPCQSVAIEAGVKGRLLYQWVRKYKLEGYNGLVSMRKGRPPKEPQMKKILRAENAYIKAEIEVIKKEIALREEKEAARLKAKKQRSSKNSKEKDTN